MAKYLFKARYTAEGAKALLEEGGSKRRQVAVDVFKSVGGKLNEYYFAFGGTDVYGIVDMPSAAAMAAASLAVNAAGLVELSTTPLLDPRELDQASKMRSKVKYRAHTR